MSKFDELTKYIPKLETGDFGEWIVDNKSKGTLESPIHFPYVRYSELLRQFQKDFLKFCDKHPEYEHTRYYDTLAANSIEWEDESMNSADVSILDEKAIIALIVGAIRAEHFGDGNLLEFLERGAITRWLNRLKEIDENSIFK